VEVRDESINKWQMRSIEYNPSISTGHATETLLNRIVAAQECDATKV
jgi:hypothetical protein